jgi:hypothetical protein
MSYLIHDNGGRPFRVGVNNDTNTISIYKNDQESKSPFLTFFSLKTFIGKSRITEFTEDCGEEFDGNCILIQIENNRDKYLYEYVYIGAEIYTFYVNSSIVSFESPIGNSDVSYTYALDEQNSVYLFGEKIKLLHTKELDDYLSNTKKDPYDYYYHRSLITSDEAFNPPRQPVVVFENIVSYYIGKNKYTLRYGAHKSGRCLQPSENNPRIIEYSDCTQDRISDDNFAKLMGRFAKLIHIEDIDTKSCL